MKKKAHQTIFREIDDMIDRAYEPEKMSPEEAIEFLQELVSTVKEKIEALREENDL